MDEALKKIEALETRLGKLESLCVALSQKIVAMTLPPALPRKTECQTSPVSPITAPALPVSKLANRFRIPRLSIKKNELAGTAVLALLYILAYALYGYYGALSAGSSFLLMSAVSIFGAALSVWLGSWPLAGLVAAVGFATPYLFGLRAASDLGYFVYTMTLNMAIIHISIFKKWRALAVVGFIGTILHFSSWFWFYYTPDKMAIAIYALSVFSLIYLVAAAVHYKIAA